VFTAKAHDGTASIYDTICATHARTHGLTVMDAINWPGIIDDGTSSGSKPALPPYENLIDVHPLFSPVLDELPSGTSPEPTTTTTTTTTVIHRLIRPASGHISEWPGAGKSQRRSASNGLFRELLRLAPPLKTSKNLLAEKLINLHSEVTSVNTRTCECLNVSADVCEYSHAVVASIDCWMAAVYVTIQTIHIDNISLPSTLVIRGFSSSR